MLSKIPIEKYIQNIYLKKMWAGKVNKHFLFIFYFEASTFMAMINIK
jgi:hypothetical protein